MPYELRGDCVHKVGEDKPMKCYPGDKEAARKYLAALEANVPDATTKAFQGALDQKEVNYLPLSMTKGKACANCRWFLNDGCFIVENYEPEPIIATGYCDRWEAVPAPAQTPVEALVEAVNEVTEAMPMVMMSHEHEEMATVAITPSAPVWTQLHNRLKRQPLKDGVEVLKDNAGRRYMYMVTSNGYKDRDNATVTTKAINEYVDHCWTNDGKFIGDNSHYIWHTKELGSISDLMFADVWSGFLVEIWREKDEPISKAFYNYVEKHPEVEWGASQGFFASKKDKESGIFKSIAKFESSSLPLAAASNGLTLSEVLPMVEKGKRDTFLNTLFKEEFGIEDAASLLKQGTEKLRKELADRGVEAKALGEGSEALLKARTEAMKTTADLMLSMVEVQDQFDRQLEKLTELQTKEIKERDDKIVLLEKKFDTETAAWQKEINDLRAIVNQPPRRASQDDSTLLKDSEKEVLKDKLPNGDALSQMFPGMIKAGA